MAVFEVLDSWTGRPVPRPQRDDLPEDEHPYSVQYTFWVIDNEDNLYVANGKYGVYYEPQAGKYRIRYVADE